MEATKRCSACKTDKPLSSFAKHRGTKDGLQSACRACHAERMKAYHATEKGAAVRRASVARCYRKKKGK